MLVVAKKAALIPDEQIEDEDEVSRAVKRKYDQVMKPMVATKRQHKFAVEVSEEVKK